MGQYVIRISETPCWVAPTPDRRRFRVLVDPRLTGSKNLAAGTLILPAGQAQPGSARHADTEEVYFVAHGSGVIELGASEFPIKAGDLVYIAPQTEHRLSNTDEEEDLEVLFVNTPALADYKPELDGWKRVNPAAGKQV